MIVVMGKRATSQDVEALSQWAKAKGIKVHLSQGEERTIVGLIGDVRQLTKEKIEMMGGVEKVMSVLKPYKLVSREFHPQDTIIQVDGVEIGGNDFVVIAGPCAIESEQQLFETADRVKKAGVKIFRASAYKPRTSPYSFQGLGLKGLKMLKKLRKETGLIVETEVMDIRTLGSVVKHVDIIRIGARNMQNFDLLKEVGKINKPVILKRGISATIEDFLLSAEYIASEGNEKVILCERGIRTFETATRSTLDLSSVPVVKELSHLPIIVDPSHAAGKCSLVAPLSKAALAVGAHGLLVEVHCDPNTALCDAQQALTPDDFDKLMLDLRRIGKALKRDIS
ncbi:MAG: 3-deoxy-7-phosphoheptulonate synthase [Candidatus Altiarchaeota archaeon]